MKETELKSIIDFDTYTRVKRAFNWESVFEQENHYYTDRGGILRKNRTMVRIRVIGDVLKIQVKLHKNSNSPLQICDETEFAIGDVPETISAGIAKAITGMDVGELYHMGVAKTKRRTLRRGDSELCLDKTTYFGKTDYEIELEYIEKMSADLLVKLLSLGVMFKQNSVGKFSRFLEEYKNHGGNIYWIIIVKKGG